eukprot:CAMPEP_0113622236 /NCGR_PEP_ID=MMETSP0017_2-20120614/11385_1 /TAXON_ID=2856 /ORGANISM="Cylindrotheca closterium" /LENGTH=421 /DNA_ID=CAMNT_0000532043 /DNA_START=133 /DNA_END=1395 /DNA_ORIENTATION=- /assembly_acc=CAM_ASM_000147
MPSTSDGQEAQQAQNQPQTNGNSRKNRRRGGKGKNARKEKVEKPERPNENLKEYFFQAAGKPGAMSFTKVEKAVMEYFIENNNEASYDFSTGWPTKTLPSIGVVPEQSTFGSDTSAFYRAQETYKKADKSRKNAEANLCALIKRQCTPTVLELLQGESTFSKIATACDSMALLKLVQEVCTKQTTTKQSEEAAVTADRRLLNFRQGKLTNLEYYDSFKDLIDVAKQANCALGASIATVQQIYDDKTITSPTDEQQAAAIDHAQEKYLSVLFITNAAPKFDDLRREIINEKAKDPQGDSPYPQTLREAVQLLTRWKPPVKHKNHVPNPNNDREGLSFLQANANDDTNQRPPSRNRPNPRGGGRGAASGRGTGGRGGRGRGRNGRPTRSQDNDEAHAHFQEADDGSDGSQAYHSDNDSSEASN